MKKVLTFTLLAAVLFGACEKEIGNIEMQHPSPNRVVLIPSEAKTAANAILVSQIGHNGKDCPGCVYNDGQMIHLDCMGFGHYCAFVTSVHLQQTGSDITATTTDTFGLTSGDFFLMPDRSLSYIDEDNNRIFLNIPEQLLFRDTTTRQFTFTGLFFSDAPAYSND